MSTPTHRNKRARTTGTNATNDTTGTVTATANNTRSHSQNLTGMKKDSTSTDSRSGSSAKAVESDELSNAEPSTVIQRMKSRLPTIINDVKNIKVTKKLSLQHRKCTNSVLVFTSKNNEKMIATGDGKYIRITCLDNNTLVKTVVNAHSGVITSLAMTKINNTDVIVSGSNDKMVKLWNIDNFEEVASFECNDFVSSLAAYELNGKYMLACGLYGGSIELWDVQSKKKVDTSKGHVYRVWKLNVFKYQNKTYLLSGDELYGGDMNKLNLWCLDDNKKLVKTLCSGNGSVDALASFEFDNDSFIAVGLRKKVMLWRMSTLEPYHQFDLHHFRSICGLKPFISNEKFMLATVNKDGWFCFLDIQNKKVVHEFKCTDNKFSSLHVCEEDGNSVFIAGGYNRTKKGCVVFLK